MAPRQVEENEDGAPLAGLRILDLTQLLPGPYATLQLARLGAHVLKIEPPGGDPARYMGAPPGGTSRLFDVLNEGKELLTLDLKQPAGKERLLELAGEADALIEGFRPGVLERLGLGWSSLHAAHPRLVLCSITALGSDGPAALRAAHDINCMALSGLLNAFADPQGRPVLCDLPLADVFGGAQPALFRLMAALLAAQRDGQGRHVQVSMTGELLDAQRTVLAPMQADLGMDAEAPGLLSGALPCYDVYAASDGRYMAVGALEHRPWAALCRVLGLDRLAPLHWTQADQWNAARAVEVRRALQAAFAAHTQAHWAAVFDAHDCCVTPVLSLAEALVH